ncbi:MAG: hypothetical protein WCN98_02200 [Verrucomicrobiaceae bacterium]
MTGTRFWFLIAAVNLTCFARVQCEEPIKEPDLTVSKDFGTARRMVTVLPDEALLRNFREADYANMALDDPLLQSAYVHVVKNSRDIITGSGLRPELLAALNDLKRRGNDATPMLLKLMKENPYTPFECAALSAAYIDTIDPGPFLEYARDALKSRWETLQATDVERIARLLLYKGIPSDVGLLREAAKKRPYLAHDVESIIALVKRPNGPPAPQTEDATPDHTDVKKRDTVKPAATPPPVASTSSSSWLAWLIVVIASTACAVWLFLRKSK